MTTGIVHTWTEYRRETFGESVPQMVEPLNRATGGRYNKANLYKWLATEAGGGERRPSATVYRFMLRDAGRPLIERVVAESCDLAGGSKCVDEVARAAADCLVRYLSPADVE